MSDYDALWKVINHEANQDDDGGFFAQLGGIQPDHDDDGPTARGLFQHMHRDHGGKLPAGLDYFHNLLSPPGPFMQALKRKPKRKHAITVRKLAGWYGNFWKFSCTPCGLSFNYPTWETAYQSATHHAHNHH